MEAENDADVSSNVADESVNRFTSACEVSAISYVHHRSVLDFHVKNRSVVNMTELSLVQETTTCQDKLVLSVLFSESGEKSCRPHITCEEERHVH